MPIKVATVSTVSAVSVSAVDVVDCLCAADNDGIDAATAGAGAVDAKTLGVSLRSKDAADDDDDDDSRRD